MTSSISLLLYIYYVLVWLKASSSGLLSTPAELKLEGLCDTVWRHTNRGSPQECERKPVANTLLNLPILNGVYCFNNGSGICKAFAGRFEFYFNTFEDKMIGPVPKSEFVDDFGYHKRVPVSYNTTGSIKYADVSINWARLVFKKSLKGLPMNLLSTSSFNWCAYVSNGWWPYKSSMLDYKSNGKYQIYFYNRQSCIINTESKDAQHYNTRFQHNTTLRIDLDYNPVMFAMEDDIAKDIRMVKHKRQHWYEVEYKVIANPTPNVKYFLDIGSSERLPCKINGESGPILSRSAYSASNFTDLCLTDIAQRRDRDSKNGQLITPFCGLEEVELVELPSPLYRKNGPNSVTVITLHNVPRAPDATTGFYGIEYTDPKHDDYKTWATKDGLTYSATTTKPIDEKSVTVISLFSSFKITPKDTYDENFPIPYLSQYKSTKVGRKWEFDRHKNATMLKDLNYVDDIAYLHQCDTVLIIFGPLYSEVPFDSFGINSKALVDSIYELGIWEMANAFFAVPDSNTLWIYHRTNYITDHKYTCANGEGSLVTATGSHKYYPRFGPSMPSFFFDEYGMRKIFDYSEEKFFELLNVYKGSLDQPQAPDPDLYKDNYDGPQEPSAPSSSSTIYIIVGLAIILLIIMCVICLLTMRRRRKDERMHKHYSSRLNPTRRSSYASGVSGAGSTRRSSMGSGRSSPNSRRTTRSSLSRPSSRSSRSTSRSAGIGSSRSRSQGSARSRRGRSPLSR